MNDLQKKAEWLRKVSNSEALTETDLQQLIRLAEKGLQQEQRAEWLELRRLRTLRKMGVQQTALYDILTIAKDGIRNRQQSQTNRLVEIIKTVDKALNTYEKEPVTWKKS